MAPECSSISPDPFFSQINNNLYKNRATNSCFPECSKFKQTQCFQLSVDGQGQSKCKKIQYGQERLSFNMHSKAKSAGGF